MKLVSFEATVALAAAIVAVGGGIFATYRGLARWYRRTIGSRRSLANRLNQLAAGVTTRWVEDRLGGPAFAREFKTSGMGGPIRELVYRNRHSWIQVLVDEHDAVVRFSITVTDPRFRFQIRDLAAGHLVGKLAHTSFSAVNSQAEPAGRSLRIGAHNHEYAEAYWFGNPGHYQWYVLSHNDVGIGAFDYSVVERLPRFQDGVLKDQPKDFTEADHPDDQLAQFRARTVVNTLTVLGPWRVHWSTELALGATGLAEPRGPDSNQVRALLPDTRERRQRRRRMRKSNRRLARQTKRSEKQTSARSIADLEPVSETSDSAGER